MTTLIILSAPCLVLGVYVYTLKQLDKEQDNKQLNKIEKASIKYLLPIFAKVGTVLLVLAFIGLIQGILGLGFLIGAGTIALMF